MNSTVQFVALDSTSMGANATMVAFVSLWNMAY